MNDQVIQADLEHLAQLAPLLDGYRQFYRQPSNPEEARQFLKDRLERGESVIFLALEEDRATGFIQIYLSFSSVALRRLWILNDLYVARDARGQGVGQALLAAIATFARESGAQGLYLTTATDNHRAQRLYECVGWQRDHAFYTYTLEV